ncbi:MAG TPA: hypothetical protein VLS25_04590 [Dehalococcoidia bacterium]|nr:hypothetical protein [Dehalococcoidia bacterium]
MRDDLKYDQLDGSIEGIVSRGERTPTGDEDVDALARLASGLRGLPDPEFKARLRAQIVPAPRSSGWRLPSALPVISWFKGQRVFLAGGGSFGMVAGTCCLIGATGHVLGIASAASITNFIDSTLPYFVALSIVSMVAWLIWLLRDRGFTLPTLGQTVWRHGVALGGAYGVVFGASMALTLAMGLQ